MMSSKYHILPSRAPRFSSVRHILLIGEYWSLLKSSTEVLRRTNSEITYCTPSEIAEQWTRQFDLIVLCHSVSAAEAECIAADARVRWPGIRILQISRFDFGAVRIPPYADGIAEGGNPQDLFAQTMELLGGRPPEAMAS